MNDSYYISIPVIQVKQNIGTFLLGKMTPKNLHAIANKNLSRMKNLESGIQRDVQFDKLKEIREYLTSTDATFPNSIIIAIQNDLGSEFPTYEYLEAQSILKVKLADDTANILDGQHRLFGFSEEEVDFELPVSIFLDISLGLQAKIFAKINSTQKKVDLDLVYDLFGMTEERSPEKVAYFVVKHLNEDLGSPWFKKIKTLSERKGDLAQGSMAKYIHKQLLEKDAIFKKLYNAERDSDIRDIISNYFSAVKGAFPDAWKNEAGNYILTKTTGFNGFMGFMILLVRLASVNNKELSVSYFASYINSVSHEFNTFDSVNYESGAIGQNKIRDILRSSLSEHEKIQLKIK